MVTANLCVEPVVSHSVCGGRLLVVHVWHGSDSCDAGTAVFPIHYAQHINASNKICMTEPRVEALNNIALQKLPVLAPHVEVVDLWQMSASREDDPMSPGDMRHNSLATYSEMALVILHTIATGS